MEKQIICKGPSVLGILGVAFVVLKLVGIINWSWWLVTLPFWGPIVVALIILLAISIIIYLNVK